VCKIFEGSTRRLPRGAGRRRHGGIDFFVYVKSSRTLVFWQEGNEVYALASEVGREEVVQLAFAKALKV
jgi:hypothetical protein